MSDPIPVEVLIAARTAVQLHFHEGEPWPGHNVDPLRCQICNDAADVASRVAFAAGRESLQHEPNDIEATGECCCNGCVGFGPCDLDPRDPADADERAENDAERIAEMSEDERERYGDL